MPSVNSASKHCSSSFLLEVSQAGKHQLMRSPAQVFQPTWASSYSKIFAVTPGLQ